MFWWLTVSHWAILAQAIPTGHMWPPAATATIDGVVQVYSVPSQVWDAFCSAVGDPGSDLRILASLPASMVSEAATLCRLGDGRGFTPVEATQVGLVYRARHQVVHVALKRPQPWEPTSQQSSSARDISLWATATSGQEGKMKLFQVAESSKAEYCTRYDSKVGGQKIRR